MRIWSWTLLLLVNLWGLTFFLTGEPVFSGLVTLSALGMALLVLSVLQTIPGRDLKLLGALIAGVAMFFLLPGLSWGLKLIGAITGLVIVSWPTLGSGRITLPAKVLQDLTAVYSLNLFLGLGRVLLIDRNLPYFEQKLPLIGTVACVLLIFWNLFLQGKTNDSAS